MDLFKQILNWYRQGFFCAQILALLALEADGEENPGLVRAMAGLNGGLGFTGNLCGCLTGGCCVLSYFTGKGEPDELEDPDARELIREYIRWFETEAGGKGNAVTCDALLDGNPANRMERCPGLVAGAFEKVMTLLSEKGKL